MSQRPPGSTRLNSVFYSVTDALDLDALRARWEAQLTRVEAQKLATLRLERDQRDYLAAHGLLRIALRETHGIGVDLARLNDHRGWSLTHADGFVACAVAEHAITAIGIDTEPVSSAERLSELMDVFLANSEREGLPSDPEARATRMVEIWTAKEAVLKALGEGFSGDAGFGVLSRLESAPLGMLDEWATISVRDARNGAAYSVWRRWVGTHALAIVALEGNEGKPRLTGVSIQ